MPLNKLGRGVGALLIAGGVVAALIGLIPFILGNGPPSPELKIEPTERYGYAPLSILANGSGSSDPDGDPLGYEWKIDGIIQNETSSLLETTFNKGGKYRLEFSVFDDKHRPSPLLELISVLPPLRDIDIPPLKADTKISEPNFTVVFPNQIVTNGFSLEIVAGGVFAKDTRIVSFVDRQAASGDSAVNGQRGSNGSGGGRHGGDGKKGGKGGDGGAGVGGQPAGTLTIKTGFISGKLNIENFGQAGGDGKDGGNGGRGGDGAKGRNRGGDALCTNDRSPGNGGDAGDGGDAGKGGDAGVGGAGGKVSIVADDLDAVIKINTSGGAAGKAGSAGEPGTAGAPGGMGRGGHCGGGGQGGGSGSIGASLQSGAVAAKGDAGEIEVSIGGILQKYQKPVVNIRREK